MCRFRPRLYSFSHMGLETLCVHAEIERAHRTPTMQGERKTLTRKNQDQFM